MDTGNEDSGNTRRGFLKTLGAAGLGLHASPMLARSASDLRNFNVLWLMADEHNPFVAGFGGDPHVATPALDAIARSGTKFTAAYSPDPICVPSRQAFHSGRMASNLDFGAGDYEAMGSYFTRMGFDTAWFGKQHWEALRNDFTTLGSAHNQREVNARFAAEGLPLPNGTRLVEDAQVSYWGTDLNEDTVTTEQALDYLDHVGQQRFFLGVSYVKPHFPFDIQKKYFERYANQPIAEPTVSQAMLDDLSTAMKSDRIRYGIDKLTPEQTRFCRAIYYGMINYVDDQIRHVMNKLERKGLRDKTIVIYMSDHGEMMGQHGIWYKNAFFEGSARIPMLVSVPQSFGAVQPRRSKAPVSAIDLFPTLCELCDLPPPATLEGRSLVPLLRGEEIGHDRVAFSENNRGGIAARMIRTSRHKYCTYADGMEQLYSMHGDERDDESVNLAPDPAYLTLKTQLRKRALAGWNPAGLRDSEG